MAHAAEIFDAQAGAYNEARRRLIPPFDAFYGTAVGALALADGQPRRILDLGAGTGILSARIRAALPDVELTLLDGAQAMLDQARDLLGDDGVTYVRADLADPLPAGRWDAVVSALAIHHLDDGAKQRLFHAVQDALRPGGVFVNAEQVSGPSDFFSAAYAAWHERSARAAGSDDAEWAAAVERMSYDRCASVEAQLGWMRSVGFDADCLFKDHHLAVLVGRR